jgi:tetratricopeptide (TPR) repeat protein
VVARLTRQAGAGETATQNAGLYLARTLRANGEFDEAERIIADVLEARRAAAGETDPDTCNARTDLGLLCADREQFERAEAILREVVAVTPPAPDEGAAIFDRALGHLLEVLARAGKPQAALDEFGDAARARFEAFPFLQVRLGQVLAALGRHDEAEQLFLKGMEGRPAWDRKNRRLTLRLLIDLCRSAGRPDDAAGYAAKLEES